LEDRHRELDFTYSLVHVFVLLGEVILVKAVTSSARVERRQAGLTAKSDLSRPGFDLWDRVGKHAKGLGKAGTCSLRHFEPCIVLKPGTLLLNCIVGKEPLAMVDHIRIRVCKRDNNDLRRCAIH